MRNHSSILAYVHFVLFCQQAQVKLVKLRTKEAISQFKKNHIVSEYQSAPLKMIRKMNEICPWIGSNSFKRHVYGVAFCMYDHLYSVLCLITI